MESTLNTTAGDIEEQEEVFEEIALLDSNDMESQSIIDHPLVAIPEGDEEEQIIENSPVSSNNNVHEHNKSNKLNSPRHLIFLALLSAIIVYSYNYMLEGSNVGGYDAFVVHDPSLAEHLDHQRSLLEDPNYMP